jgi:hypothetical protein
MEEEGPFSDDAVDLDDWSRRVRNVNAALRSLQTEPEAPKARGAPKPKAKPATKPLEGTSSPSLP